MDKVQVIRYNSPLHRRIKEAILARYRLSHRHMQKKHEQWRKSEENFIAYVPETEANLARRDVRENVGVPQYTTIEIPLSYAMAMTAHMYWSSVFLGRNPVLQYQGRHGEGQLSEQAVETIMNYQASVGGMMVPWYCWLMDMSKYGIGIIGTYWDEEHIVMSQIVEENEKYLGLPIPGTKKKIRRATRTKGYVGNRAFNIRPYDWFPDPRVPLNQVQKGEFCAHMEDVGWNAITEREQDEYYFNIDVLRKRRNSASFGRETGSAQIDLPEPQDYADFSHAKDDIKDMGFVSTIHMVIELIPAQWGLGSTKYPEKWYFCLADKEIVICARPLGSYHNKFPYFTQEYEIDAYQLHKRSILDVLRPMNNILTWLFETHFQNVRKVINDNVIVDPSKLVMKDVLSGGAGKLWRLRPEAYGTDPRMAAYQFQVVDVTQQHMRDAQVIMDIMSRVSGINDNIMGMVNAGGRKTASEVRSSNTLGINRLKVIAEYNSSLGWSPMSQVLLQETQQRYDMERFFRIANGGMMSTDPQAIQETMMQITPESIAGFYDFVTVDGTLPVDRYAQASLMRESLNDAANMMKMGVPLQLDFMKALEYIWMLNGVRTFDRFRIKVVPDHLAQQSAQAGNIVPIGGQGGGNRRGPSGPAATGAGGAAPVPGSGAAPGVG